MATQTKRQARIYSAARYAAMRRLQQAHAAEFLRYYNEEAEARGVQTRNSTHRTRVAELEEQLAALRRQLEGVEE